MTIAPKRLARPLRLALLTIAPGTACLAAPALADTRTSLDLAAGGMYDSNPFLADDSGGDVAVTLQATPRLQISDNVSSLNILGDFLVRQFVKSANGSDITGTASVAGTHRASPFFTINAGANYLTSSNGLNLGFSNVRPDDPLPPPTTPLPDITLGGTRTRTHMVSGNAGFSLRASPRDMIGANVTAARNFFDGDGGLGARDFSFINGGLNYSRTLSRRRGHGGHTLWQIELHRHQSGRRHDHHAGSRDRYDARRKDDAQRQPRRVVHPHLARGRHDREGHGAFRPGARLPHLAERRRLPGCGAVRPADRAWQRQRDHQRGGQLRQTPVGSRHDDAQPGVQQQRR
jgi:hypothetical protein